MDPKAEEGVDDEGTTFSAFRLQHETISSFELWQIQKKKKDLRLEYLDHWNASISVTGTGRPVDALISPCAPFAAPPHGRNK
jgi:amidase